VSKQTIQNGSAPGDDGGEYLYYAFKKCNENFTELYDADVTIAAAAASAQSTANGKEDYLDVPTVNGYILSSTTAGVRSWIAPASGGGAVDSVNGQTGVVVLAKSDVGLGSVDNTSDVNKPISTATQSALDAKEPADATILKDADIGVTVASQTALVAAGDEYTDAGILVYPSHAVQSVYFNPDSTVDYYTCSYNSKTWTLAFTYDSATGNVTVMTAGDGTSQWTNTITYNSDGSMVSPTGWISV